MNRRPWIETDGHRFHFTEEPRPMHVGAALIGAMIVGLISWALAFLVARYWGLL